MAVHTLTRNCNEEASLSRFPAVRHDIRDFRCFLFFRSEVDSAAHLCDVRKCLYFSCRCLPLFTERKLDQQLAEFRIGNAEYCASCGRRLVASCREGICLEAVHSSVFAHHKIKTAVIFDTKGSYSVLCVLLHFFRLLLRQYGRAGINSSSGFVFVRVIIKAFDRRDLDDRICFSVYNTDRELSSLNIFLTTTSGS